MNRFIMLSAAAGVVFAAGLAVAAEPYGSERSGGAAVGTPGAHGSGAAQANEHRMNGVITEIDKTKGKVSIDANGQTMQLVLPSSELANFKKGDRVTVTAQLERSGGAGSREPEMPGSRGGAMGGGAPGGGAGGGVGGGVSR